MTMTFSVDQDGEIRRLGDGWDRVALWSPLLLGERAGHGAIRTTITVQVANGWAMYRVDGIDSTGALRTTRIRRGQGKRRRAAPTPARPEGERRVKSLGVRACRTHVQLDFPVYGFRTICCGGENPARPELW
jgi:hypothetical protein